MFLYLRVCQAGNVGFEVVDDALGGSRQGGTTHQQHKQHYIWKGGCQVHHLECTHTHTPSVRGCGRRDRANREDVTVMSSKTGKKYYKEESWSLKIC